MKLGRRISLVLGALLFVTLISGCDGLLNAVDAVFSAPYGYVYDYNSVGVADATVTVYKVTSVATAAADAVTANIVKAAAKTTSTGYFSLLTKVDSKGGIYLVRVVPATNSILVYEDTIITVDAEDYLINIGAIRPKSGLYNVSGKVINVRAFESKVGYAIPSTGTVELRKFGATTAAKTATLAADGTYTIYNAEPGSYFVTFVKATADTTAWIGIPVTVEVTGGNVTNVGSFVYTGVPAGSILLVLTWENKAYDIDSHIYVDTDAAGTSATRVNPTLDTVGRGTVTWERDVVATKYVAGSTTTTSPGYDLLSNNAIDQGAYPVETTLVSSLAQDVDLRFYAKAFLTNTSISGLDDKANSIQPAGVKLYAMSDGVHYGTWTAPLNTSETAVGMVQIVGNADTSITISTFGGNTPKALGPVYGKGTIVSIMR